MEGAKPISEPDIGDDGEPEGIAVEAEGFVLVMNEDGNSADRADQAWLAFRGGLFDISTMDLKPVYPFGQRSGMVNVGPSRDNYRWIGVARS